MHGFTELDKRGEKPLFGRDREIIQTLGRYSPFDIVMMHVM